MGGCYKQSTEANQGVDWPPRRGRDRVVNRKVGRVVNPEEGQKGQRQSPRERGDWRNGDPTRERREAEQ